ncbi:MAG: winged helix-turn-helix domain-containing protein [Candidatus Dormibacteraceae bacterium]
MLLTGSGRLARALMSELRGRSGRGGLEVAWHRTWPAVLHEREADALVLEGADPIDLVGSARRITGAPLLAMGGGDPEALACLELGADAWMPAAASAAVVAAQVLALLRARERRPPAPARLRLGRLELDMGARRVMLGGRELELSPREFALLGVLVAQAGRAMSRDRLLAAAWGPRFFGEPKTVDVHVAWLRAKLEGSGVRVTTLRGIGYRLDSLDESFL